MKMRAKYVLVGLLMLFLLSAAGLAGATPFDKLENKSGQKFADWKEKTFNENKERMMQWVQNCERWVEKMQEKVNKSNLGEESKLRIQERIRNMELKVEQIRTQINNSSDYEELRLAMREVRKLWINMSKEMRLIAYEHAITQMENVIEKLEELVDRFESYGLDTTKLRNAINDANSTLARVKEKLANGEDVFRDIKELKKKIEIAFAEAKKLAREYKPKPSNGIVNANVNGTFNLSGTIHALIKGTGDVKVNPESAMSRANGTVVAIVVRGDATVEGNGSFKIIVHGNGTLEMNGNGSYAYKECVNEKFKTASFNETITIKFGCDLI